mgnify:CR=1 FL=1
MNVQQIMEDVMLKQFVQIHQEVLLAPANQVIQEMVLRAPVIINHFPSFFLSFFLHVT